MYGWVCWTSSGPIAGARLAATVAILTKCVDEGFVKLLNQEFIRKNSHNKIVCGDGDGGGGSITNFDNSQSITGGENEKIGEFKCHSPLAAFGSFWLFASE